MPEGTFEREISKEGFYGPAAFMHHPKPPTGWTSFEGALRPRAFDLNRLNEPQASPWDAPVVLSNGALEMRFWKPEGPLTALARNADGDQLLFVHEGAGDLFCDCGPDSVFGRRLPLPAARDHVAARAIARRGDPDDRGDQRAPEPAGEGASGRARVVRSGDAGHPRDGRGVPRPPGDGRRFPGADQEARAGLCRDLSVQSARRRRLARRACAGAPERDATSGRWPAIATTCRRACTRPSSRTASWSAPSRHGRSRPTPAR